MRIDEIQRGRYYDIDTGIATHWGYPPHSRIRVKAHCKTENRVKCEFRTMNGIVHRWLKPNQFWSEAPAKEGANG